MTTVAELLTMDGVEENLILGGRFGFLAFHGGLEGGTETIATEAASASGASLYTIVQPPSVRWHVPSHVVGAEASPRLEAFLAHVEVAVAVHGYGRPDRRRDLLLGGLNRTLAAQVATALREQLPAWTVVDDLDAIPREMRGLHPTNPVNRCRDQGVQIELPPGVRQQAGLVDALVAVATRW